MSITTQTNTDIWSLKEHELFVLDERYSGTRYRDIAEELEDKFEIQIAEKTMRMWFSKNGRLYDAYKTYAKERNQIELEATEDFIRSQAYKAANCLVRIMTKGGTTSQVMAAREILDRSLGKVRSAESQDSQQSNTLEDFIKLLDVCES